MKKFADLGYKIAGILQGKNLLSNPQFPNDLANLLSVCQIKEYSPDEVLGLSNDDLKLGLNSLQQNLLIQTKALLGNNFRNFNLAVRQSSVKDAGNGVFLEDVEVNRGDLVGFYPGRVIFPVDFSKAVTETDEILSKEIFEDNQHKILRFDRVLINANPLVNPRSEADRDLARKCRKNPFAVGHIINHPPKQKSPNVVIAPFNFPKVADSEADKHFDPFSESVKNLNPMKPEGQPSFPADLAELIPHDFYRDPSWIEHVGFQHSLWSNFENIQMLSIAIVASRKISPGEELFLDYRFNPSSKDLPSWYAPVDENASTKRWSS